MLVTSTGSIWVLKLAIVEVVRIEQPHPNVAAWTLTGDTQRDDHNAAIVTNVVTDHAIGNDVATVYVYVSDIDGAIVIDIDACTNVRVRTDINDNMVHNTTIPA